jgi:L-alanine-DL-glutamate epimerase-like enolase superfamily enzyme
VRAALPDVTLTVDANGGWSRWQAKQMLPVLADCGVSLVEQPLVAGDETGTAALAERSPVPIFLDESVTSTEDVRRFADCAHGVNIKVSKLGGPLESLQALRAARAHGLSTMIGCMGESSLGIAPAVHLSSLADHLDLFGPHALATDPAQGLSWNGPTVARPTAPGIGTCPRA